jgi:hypothetical protein
MIIYHFMRVNTNTHQRNISIFKKRGNQEELMMWKNVILLIVCLVTIFTLVSCNIRSELPTQFERGYHLIIFQVPGFVCLPDASSTNLADVINQGIAYIDIGVEDIASYSWPDQEIILTDDASEIMMNARSRWGILGYHNNEFAVILDGELVYCGKVDVLHGPAGWGFPVIYMGETENNQIRMLIREEFGLWLLEPIPFDISESSVINNQDLEGYLENQGLLNN